MPSSQAAFVERWPIFRQWPEAIAWLEMQANLGLAPRTLEAYARGVADYFSVCAREAIDPLTAERPEVARYVRDLTRRARFDLLRKRVLAN